MCVFSTSAQISVQNSYVKTHFDDKLRIQVNKPSIVIMGCAVLCGFNQCNYFPTLVNSTVRRTTLFKQFYQHFAEVKCSNTATRQIDCFIGKIMVWYSANEVVFGAKREANWKFIIKLKSMFQIESSMRLNWIYKWSEGIFQ